MRRERKIVEIFNKSNEAIKYFEKLIRSPRSNNDTLGLGYTSIEEGESSKFSKEKNIKGKNSKPTCHYCGKKGHTTNVCRRKNTHQHANPKNTTHYHK